jgi:hypothetical protein
MRTRFRWTTATIVVAVALFGFATAAQTTNVTQTKHPMKIGIIGSGA